MGNINYVRVLLGGLVAGVVFNVGEAVLNLMILNKETEEMVQRLNLPPIGNDFIMKATALSFVLGIVSILMYAWVRSRLGAGVSTAILTGVVIWFMTFVYSSLLLHWMGIYPLAGTIKALGWELGETVLATLAGAWIYKDK